jgi:hypothetical protein
VSRAEPGPKKACCMISEILEETGLDRERVRAIRRQVLEGVVLLCQWQLERMEKPAEAASGRKARKVTVE